MKWWNNWMLHLAMQSHAAPVNRGCLLMVILALLGLGIGYYIGVHVL